MIKNIPDDANFLFFWGHQPTKDGTIAKSCLSQWWISKFQENEKEFFSAEQYMMYQKATLFKDEEIAVLILNTKDPKKCKSLGRKVKGFNDHQWDEHKYEFVRQANFLKFSQHKDLAEFLKSTMPDVIVEASPYDQIWGIGLKQDDPRSKSPSTWCGDNLLGFALMEVRDSL